MNCKQGDLAVIVNGRSAGSIRVCVERYDGPWQESEYCPGWRLDRPIVGSDGRLWFFRADMHMRPIRDNDGDDESLTWAGKPEVVAA